MTPWDSKEFFPTDGKAYTRYTLGMNSKYVCNDDDDGNFRACGSWHHLCFSTYKNTFPKDK